MARQAAYHRKAVSQALIKYAQAQFSETERQLGNAYAEDPEGDVSPLTALADHLMETQPKGRNWRSYAKLLKRIAAERDPDFHFFFHNAGSSYRPDTQTSHEGRIKNAYNLSKAEDYFERERDAGRLRFRWEPDEDHDPEVYTSPIFYGVLENYRPPMRMIMSEREGPYDWRHVSSLGGVEFAAPHDDPYSDPYHRVVQAEMVHENMENLRGPGRTRAPRG